MQKVVSHVISNPKTYIHIQNTNEDNLEKLYWKLHYSDASESS